MNATLRALNWRTDQAKHPSPSQFTGPVSSSSRWTRPRTTVSTPSGSFHRFVASRAVRVSDQEEDLKDTRWRREYVPVALLKSQICGDDLSIVFDVVISWEALDLEVLVGDGAGGTLPVERLVSLFAFEDDGGGM